MTSSVFIPVRGPPFEASTKVKCSDGWMVIQKMYSGSSSYRYKRWHDYTTGFGYHFRSMWFGNKHLHELTGLHRYKLLIYVQKKDKVWVKVAEYENFYIENERHKFRLHVDNFKKVSTDAVDSFNDAENHLGNYQNGQPFSTMDKDNDQKWTHCSVGLDRKAGWWFNGCGSYLNGYKGTHWGNHYDIVASKMLIAPHDD